MRNSTAFSSLVKAISTLKNPARLVLLLAFAALFSWSIHDTTRASDEPELSLLISEFMAANRSTLPDRDGDYSDWIELYNPTSDPVHLDGWFLTDDDNDLTQWQFPDVTLAAQQYLVVFASGKDRARAGEELHTNFKLQSTGEYLALVTPDGATVAWEYAPDYETGYPTPSRDASFSRLGSLLRRRRITPQYPPQFADASYGLDAALRVRYFVAPTPGTANGTEAADQGPLLSDAAHVPSQPQPGDDLTITVSARPAARPVDAVTLHYRITFGDTVDLPMLDDGAHGDGAAGDGTYGVILPGDAYAAGELVRYYVTAADLEGRTSRWPLFHAPTLTPRYLGTMIADPGVQSDLPILYWFVKNPDAARSMSGTRASLFYDGVLYDNIFVRSRGYSSRTGWPKKSFKFDFNSGDLFQFSPDLGPVQEINLNNTYSDKAYIRQVLAAETYRDAGVPSAVSVPVRLQQNGTFHSVAILVEHPDERFLVRQGLDPNGALYKMYSGASSSTDRVDKRTRLYEDHRDLQALIDALDLKGQERTNAVFDRVNIPAVVNYLAATTVMHDADCDRKNYFMYRDTLGTGEWTFLPWDKDLTFGRNFIDHVLNEQIWADHYPQSYPFNLGRNHLIGALYDMPIIREMYLRRLRTLMDDLLQPPGTPVEQRYYERRIDELVAQMQADVALDAEMWPFDWGSPQTFAQAIEILETEYLQARRVYLYETLGPDQAGLIPQAQPADAQVELGPLESDPPSGDQDHEYLTLINRNGYAIDLSGWTISDDVRYTFQPGVVLPAGGTLYVSPDVTAFRSRPTSPTGGQGHFVQGNYRGRLSNAGGLIRLYNAEGTLIDTKIFA